MKSLRVGTLALIVLAAMSVSVNAQATSQAQQTGCVSKCIDCWFVFTQVVGNIVGGGTHLDEPYPCIDVPCPLGCWGGAFLLNAEKSDVLLAATEVGDLLVVVERADIGEIAQFLSSQGNVRLNMDRGAIQVLGYGDCEKASHTVLASIPVTNVQIAALDALYGERLMATKFATPHSRRVSASE